MKKEISIERFLTQMPVDFKVAEKDICLSGVYLEIDSMSGKASYIKRIQKKLNI
jgi:calcineurin-like phosphoesterase